MMYLPYILFIGIAVTLLWLIALLKKDNSIVDIFWGIGFCLVALLGLYRTDEIQPVKIVMSIAVLSWGLRLSIYLFRRNAGKPEDFRYAQWRKEWGKTVVWRSYLQVFLLQGFFMFIISLPLIHVYLSDCAVLHPLSIVGALVWLLGFLTETIADRQMYVFKQNPAHQGKIMTQGIWKISRHPNYFGEIVQWWGIFMIASAIPNVWISLISPITITWLLLKVSGVPMLEKKYKDNSDYKNYIAQTPALFPTFKSLKAWIQG